MGKTLKKKTFLRKRSQKRKKPFLGKRSQKRKKPFLGKRSQKRKKTFLGKRSQKRKKTFLGKRSRKRKKGKRKSKNYKMRGGQLIIRGNPGAIVPGGGPDTPPPLTNGLSYPPWFHVWGHEYASTSVIVRFRDIHGTWERVHLYGTSMPNQTHGCDGIDGCKAVYPGRGVQAGSRMYRTMGYFMYGKGVNKWISLQACGDKATGGLHPHRSCLPGGTTDCCQGNPNALVGSVSINKARAENDTWRTLKNLTVSNAGDHDIEMLDILMTDMTVGKISSWKRINDLRNFGEHTNSSVFHCLAGWGRTGTVFLFYILRNELKLRRNYLNLHKPWFGKASSIEIYDMLFSALSKSIRHHCCHLHNHPVSARVAAVEPLLHKRVTRFPLKDIYKEVMEIGNARGARFCGNLLISRINTIMVMLWYYIYMDPGVVPVASRDPNWSEVCLYHISTSPMWIAPHIDTGIFTRASVFSQHKVVNMSHFFQPGGLPINPTVQHPVAPGGHGLINLNDLTNHFGIQF